MKNFKRTILIMGFVSLVFLLSLITGQTLNAQEIENESPGAFEEVECWFDSPIPFLVSSDYECGYVSVPYRHDSPDGPQIRIPIAILKTTSENPEPDPLFLAQGGPGGDAFEVFPILVGNMATELNRDIIIFNQRGTRYAEPTLLCTESFNAAADILQHPPKEADELSLNAISKCHDRLVSEGIDLSAFNSLENAADIETIRKVLGYDEYNFYGVSYGTLLGLHLMGQRPEKLRSVVLDGVVPPNINFITQIASNTDRVFSQIIQACSQDPGCRTEYPNLEERFFKVVQDLNESPRTLKIKDSDSGKLVEAYLDGDVLVDVLFQAFYLSDSYALFPKLVDNLEKGDFTFIEGIWPLFAFDRTLSEGMYFSVICAEDADFLPDEANIDGIRPFFAESAESELQSYLDACQIWQVDELPPSIDDPVTSAVPTLLLSGQYDPITPPGFAEVAAADLENSYSFVQPTGSHGNAFENECSRQIVQQFINNPTQEPDMSCKAAITPAAFISSDTFSFPFLAEINQLSPNVWWELGLATVFLLGVLSSFLIIPLVWLIRYSRKRRTSSEGESKKSSQRQWLAGLLFILFGLLAIVFVAGATFFTIQSLFGGLASIFALSGDAAPLFLIPIILILIAIIATILTINAWFKNLWSVWMRLYFSFLSICALGYVTVLAMGGMMTVLF